MTDCAICYEKVDNRTKDYLPCKHKFHVKCLINLIKAECPMCRANITSSLPPYIIRKINANASNYKKHVYMQELENLRNETTSVSIESLSDIDIDIDSLLENTDLSNIPSFIIYMHVDDDTDVNNIQNILSSSLYGYNVNITQT